LFSAALTFVSDIIQFPDLFGVELAIGVKTAEYT
jgi:hypothetical protein